MKIAIISDNPTIFNEAYRFLKNINLENVQIEYFSTSQKPSVQKSLSNICSNILFLSIKENVDYFIDNFDVLFSLHCLEIIPGKVIQKVKSINVHPGYNPYNRGWYPHVFSIINKLPAGASIHEMDEQIDAGPLIDRRIVAVSADDDSESLYQRIVEAEISLFKEYFFRIIENNYTITTVQETGNINYKKDYKKLCLLDLDKYAKYSEFIDHLRALSHGQYKNAYFINEEGKKIYLKLSLIKDIDNESKSI